MKTILYYNLVLLMAVPASIKPHLLKLVPSATLAINEKSAALQHQGHRIHRLGLGQSPFPVPEPVVEALKNNAFQKDYMEVQGLRVLREAVADYTNHANRLLFSADNILIGPGSKELMFILQLVFQGELILPTPCWVSYLPQAQLAGNQVQLVETHFEDKWRLQPQALDRACTENPTTPKLLILNYPNNPHGMSYHKEHLKALAEVAQKHRVLILSDEIYAPLTFKPQHESIANFYPEGTIISSGLSKWCGAGGWRLGTLAFPESLKWLLEKMCVVASETFTSVSAPIQQAAISAYTPNSDIQQYLENSNQIMKAICDFTWHSFKSMTLKVHASEGGFYTFPDFSAHRDSLKAKGISTSPALCQALLEDTGVASLPGTDFLRPAEELTLRLALVDFDGAKALTACAKQNAPLDASFVKEFCPSVVEAVGKIEDWLAHLKD